MPKDTHELFDAFTTNKPSTWHRARTVVIDALNRAQIQALNNLPIIDIDADQQPLTDCDRYPADAANGQTECIVRRPGISYPEYYYVNTCGYSYAREAFRLIGWENSIQNPQAFARVMESEVLFLIAIHHMGSRVIEKSTLVRLTSAQAESLAKRLASKGVKFSIECIKERDREGLMRWLNDCGVLIDWGMLPS